MRRNLDKIQIVEPPLEEFTKKYSRATGCRRGCFTSCFLLVLIIIGAGVFLRFSMGPGPQTVKKVPANFPNDIPIYDPDAIDQITFISGKYKSRGIEIAAFFPKLILSPLLLRMDKTESIASSTANNKWETARNLWRIIREPVGDHRDTVQIEWRDLNAEPKFVLSFYKTDLGKNGYEIQVESESKESAQFSFNRGGVSGSLFVREGKEKQVGTEYAILTVNIPSANTSSTVK